MAITLQHRHALATLSLVSYLGVFAANTLFASPGLNIGLFFVVSVALLALATGPITGALGGAVAAILWAISTLINPGFDGASAMFTGSSLIELIVLTSVGALIGWYAAANREMFQSLNVIAQRDFLTGLGNTRAYEAAIQRRLAAGEPFALLLGDMDGLKKINDLRGHREGNAALRRLAEMLRANLRDDDEVSRVGGDEFALLTATGTSGAAWGLASRLEGVLADGGTKITFGWAVYPDEGTDEATLYRTADRRLYARKFARNKGRSDRAGGGPTVTDFIASAPPVALDEG